MASSYQQAESLSKAVNGRLGPELQQQALDRQSFANYSTIYREFMARGIPEADIKPRVNVFTYNAWQALGRQVRKGEHGVKVVTFITAEKLNRKTGKRESSRRPWSSTVFHVSQTDEVKAVQS